MEQKIEVLPDIGSVTHISWGSVIAGTIIALMVQFTWIMLGLAIGFGVAPPAVQGGALGGLGIGAAIWWILGSIISLFVGGWVASRMAGIQRLFDGILHGLVTWGLVTLITVYILSSGIGTVIGGAFGVVRDALTVSGQVASSLPQIYGQLTGGQGGMGNIVNELQQSGATNPQIMNEVRNNVQKMLQGNYTSADRKKMIGVISANSDLNNQQATALVQKIENTVQQAPAQLQQAQQTAQEVAQTAARVLSVAAIASFIMLILTAGAAGLGGWVGRVRGPVEV